MTGNQQLRNILKSINFGELTAAQVNQVGSGVFADINAKSDMKNLNEITNAWRAVTNPSYGQFIPQSGAFFEATGSAYLLSPSGNEVYKIILMQIQNPTLGGITATVKLTTSNLASDEEIQIYTASVGAGETILISNATDIQLDSNSRIQVSGDSLQFTLYAAKVAI